MARGGSPVAQYAVLGVLGLFAFNWAEKQAVGSTARHTADQLKGALGKVFGQSAAASPAIQPGFVGQRSGEQAASQAQPSHGTIARPGGGVLIPTRLLDFGKFPVVFDPQINGLEQDPTLGGTNVYSPGDAFVDTADGKTWVWQGGTTFDDGTGTTTQLGQFEVS